MSEIARYSSVRRPNSVRKIITVLVITTLALGALPAAALLISLSLMRAYGENDLAKAGAKTLTIGVKSYQLRYESYPARLDQLVQPPDGGPFVLPGALLDPWGRPFQYDPAGPRNHGKQPDIWTVTPKGEVIGNWP
jgi:general secretion pathway protein G